MARDELRRRVKGLARDHRMELDRVVTPGGMNPQKLPRLRFAAYLSGKAALDVARVRGGHAVRNRENPFAVVQRGRSVFWARRR